MYRLLYLIITLLALMLAALVEWNTRVGMQMEVNEHRSESAEETEACARDIELTFNTIYRASRTIARLPGVQSLPWDESYTAMDRSGTTLDDNTRLTIQEIYNALAMDVAVSELYIVPLNLDPDGEDPLGLAPLEPVITFDDLIVGKTGASDSEHGDGHGDGHGDDHDEEVEIFEYRLMREQLDWMAANFPDWGHFSGMEYPAISGPPIITCDNSEFDPAEPDDEDRMGLIYSVPIYDTEGLLRGCVSAVILNRALGDLLETGDHALMNLECGYVVSHEVPGEWARFTEDGIRAEPDPGLIYSSVTEVSTADSYGSWLLWAGLPNDALLERNDVHATQQARIIGHVAVFFLALGATVGTMIVIGAYKRIAATNARLEETVAERTADLMHSRDDAVRSLQREQFAMSEKEKALQILEQIASTDRLTELPNRAAYLERLQKTMHQSRQGDGKFAVLFFDFDRFKIVNDSLGHDVGDALLCNIADVFRRELRDSDTAARFGGDEFVVLLDGLSGWKDAKYKAETLLDALAEPHIIDGNLIVSTASIGLVTNQHAYDTPLEMIRDADAAMYQAKENGKAQVVVFDKTMHENALDRLQIEADLRNAVENNEFRLVYQPIIDLATGHAKGLEALVRWHHPTRGLVNPNDFIYIAEDTGLICEIGHWVLWTAAAFLADINQQRPDDAQLSINVNVSKRQLLETGFYDDVLACQARFGLYDGELQLEITESVIVDVRSNIVPLLEKIRAHNIHIAMDDFGTGVSSLSSLHTFPIDVLKIDQSFIMPLNGDRSLLAVVSSIANLAENLGIQTVAEGIEDEAVIGVLQSIGCTWGQGYHFAKPLPADEALAYLHKERSEQRRAA